MRESKYKAYIETSILVLAFFPITYFIELKTFTFFVPFVEEGLERLIPLLVVIYFHRNVDSIPIGIVAGITFGILEIITKTIHIGYFSPLVIVPVLAVHIPNAIAQSVVIKFCYSRRSYALIPVIYVICVFWHWIYNANLYVV